jgi:imidazolonepropionase-like amidohydrolase
MIYRGRVFDGLELLEFAEFEIDEKNGNIKYLEETRKTNPRQGGKKSKLQDITFLPGLIDTHIHFFGTQNHSLMDWVLTSDVMLTIKSVKDAESLLNSGFTTVRTMGDKVSLDMSRAEKNNMLYGPRIISSGYSIAETGGNDDPKFLPLERAKELSYSYYCDGPWECRKAVRMNLRNGAESIKAYSSRSFVGGGKIKDELTVEELTAITDEAHRAHLKAASHAYGESAILNSIDSRFDSIEHGLGLTEDLAERMKKMNIFYVPTLSVYKRIRSDVNEYRDQMIKKHIEKEVKIAQEAGVKIAAGTDYVGTHDEPHGLNYIEISCLSEVIGNRMALRAATSSAAECLGIENIGRIKEGFVGNVIAVKGNPMEDINSLRPENVLLVIKGGRIMKNLL